MKAEFIRCPHCGLLHPTTARSCPATGAALPHVAPDAEGAPRAGIADAEAARLVVQTAEGERTFYLRPMNSLGRHPNNSIQILDKIVSKEHCRIEREDERFILRDLGSLNGTFINGERVRGVSPLNHGDMITLGATRAFFYEARAAAPSSDPPEDTSAERFLAHLSLDKPLYRPGETLYARAAVLDASTRAPLGRAVTLAFEVRSARAEIVVNRAGQVAAGVAPFSWEIPADLAAGDYTLLCLFPADGFPPAELPFSIRPAGGAGAGVATPSEPAEVRLSLYPEGGELVVGLPTRLYVEARTAAGKPAHVAGRIIDGTGAVLARFHTEHEGRGRVALTPARAGRAYMAVLDEPAGMSELCPLPEVVREGIVLTALDDVIGPEEAVRLRILSGAATRARVSLCAREREVAAVRVDLPAGEPREVALTPPGTVDGVLRATVYDAAGIPRAERLVFRKPGRSLRVAIEATPAPASQRGRVTLKIRATTAEGQPAAAMVTIAVVDDAALAAFEPRERHPRLPAQALLGADVQDLGDPEAYLGEDATAARRLDLLLGVQGWRRFAFHDISRFIADHGDRADRALARRRPVAPALAMIMPGPPRALVTGPQAAPPQATPLQAALAIPLPEPNAPTAPRAPIVAAQRLEIRPPAGFLLRPSPIRWGSDQRERRGAEPPLPAPGPAGRPAALVIAREYAHRAAPFEGKRDLYPDTVYWNAGIPLRDKGEATILFDLGDAITTFRVRADAFGPDGALGQGDATIEARSPFYIETRLPLEVSAGDVIDLPVMLVNGTTEALDAQLSLVVSGPLLAGREPHAVAIAAGGRERTLLPIAVGPGEGVFPVEVSATAGKAADTVRRTLTVAPARPQPAAGSGKVALTTALAGEEVAEGHVILLHVELVSASAEPLPKVVAVLGLPGGLTPRAEPLQALVHEGRITAWEARGRELEIHHRSLGPGERSSLSIVLGGAVPGTYQGPASRARLDGADADEAWAPPLRVRVVAER